MLKTQLTSFTQRFRCMGFLLTLTILFFSTSFCSGQISETTNPYPSSLVLGVSFHGLASSSDVRRYSLRTIDDGYYSEISNKHRSPFFMRLQGEFQFTHIYVRGGLGIRSEHTHLEAHNFQEYHHFDVGQSYDTEVQRDLYINEKTTSLIISIEAGSYFLRRDRPFRVGMGVGFDYCAYLPSKETDLNALYKEDKRIISSSPEIYDISNSAHDKGSEEWNSMVRQVNMPLVVPKLSLKASYRIYPNISISTESQMRFLFLQTDANQLTTVLEFPIGVGFNYHFSN